MLNATSVEGENSSVILKVKKCRKMRKIQRGDELESIKTLKQCEDELFQVKGSSVPP